ncbi:MAG: WhiB family transcriptional regulator [Candidatus Saccharimonadales bacterium]
MSVQVADYVESMREIEPSIVVPAEHPVDPEKLVAYIAKITSTAERAGVEPPRFDGSDQDQHGQLLSAARTALSNTSVRGSSELMYARLARYLSGVSVGTIAAQEEPPTSKDTVTASLTRIAMFILGISTTGTAYPRPRRQKTPRTKSEPVNNMLLAQIIATPPVSPNIREFAPCTLLTTNPTPDIFTSGDPDEANQALTICEECPVRIPCLALSVRANRQEPGIVGGVRPSRRTTLRALWAKHLRESERISA